MSFVDVINCEQAIINIQFVLYKFYYLNYFYISVFACVCVCAYFY